MLTFPKGNVWGIFWKPRWISPTWPHLKHVGGVYRPEGGVGLEARAE